MQEQHNVNTKDESSPEMRLSHLISGIAATHMVFAAAKLCIADRLKDGAKSSEELARETNVHPRALYRLLRGLTALGIFAEVEPGHFSLTPMAELLRSDVPGSMRSWATIQGEEWARNSWGNILYGVKTNKPAFSDQHGMGIYDYFAKHPEAAEGFNDAMTCVSGQEAAAVLAVYNFAGIRNIVDVGGGHGRLISAVLDANPQMRGVLFDLPSVVKGAKEPMDSTGVSDRCQLVSGDFFESVPGGGDAYILKSIIHCWSDERALVILSNCRRAMKKDGRLLLVERDLPAGAESSFGKIFDVIMLVFQDGFERTEAEYSRLMEASGFQLTRVLRTPSPMNVFEGIPV